MESQKLNKEYKEEQTGNFRTEKYYNPHTKTHRVAKRAKWRLQIKRIELQDWTIETI